MTVCIDCFKLFQTISNKTKLAMVRAANQSREQNVTSCSDIQEKKKVFYILFERIIIFYENAQLDNFGSVNFRDYISTTN